MLKVFFTSDVMVTFPHGLLLSLRPNHNRFGAIKSIVSKSETTLPSAKGKSLILYAISLAQVSD